MSSGEESDHKTPLGHPMNHSGLHRSRWQIVLAVLGLGLAWSYWPTLMEMGERWAHDPQYSHGYFVPPFSAYLLWRKRSQLAELSFASSWWGVVLLVGSVACRLAGSYFFIPWLDPLSLLPALAGLVVLAGGTRALRLTWVPLAFLIFVLPLPYSVQTALAQPLQRMATVATTYLLETMGYPAVARGNVILLNDMKVGVVEACNGLSMLITFVALATAVAILSQRGWVERTAVLLSAIPIALIANVMRITVTTVLQERVGGEAARVFFHDFAGWLMMPIGLALLGLLLWTLRRLVETEPPLGPPPETPQPEEQEHKAVPQGEPGDAPGAGVEKLVGAASG